MIYEWGVVRTVAYVFVAGVYINYFDLFIVIRNHDPSDSAFKNTGFRLMTKYRWTAR
jgi:hypothetical protein